ERPENFVGSFHKSPFFPLFFSAGAVEDRAYSSGTLDDHATYGIAPVGPAEGAQSAGLKLIGRTRRQVVERHRFCADELDDDPVRHGVVDQLAVTQFVAGGAFQRLDGDDELSRVSTLDSLSDNRRRERLRRVAGYGHDLKATGRERGQIVVAVAFDIVGELL